MRVEKKTQDFLLHFFLFSCRDAAEVSALHILEDMQKDEVVKGTSCFGPCVVTNWHIVKLQLPLCKVAAREADGMSVKPRVVRARRSVQGWAVDSCSQVYTAFLVTVHLRIPCHPAFGCSFFCKSC